MYKNVLLDAPNVGELELKYLQEAIEAGYVSTIGPFVGRFEKLFAEYISAKKAVSTQSGTAAIHMALHELGVGEGDEVIVPALTFVATVNPVIYAGATPVFADVDINTWNISPEEIRKKITPRTKAIIPVHLYGNPCKMNEIMDIARENGLYVIEDASESLGSTYKGKFTGTFGDFGCFSFNGNKLITTGGGGMIVSNNVERIEHIRYLVNQSKDKDIPGFHSEIGFNYRMTNIEAALGIAQSERLEGFLTQKKEFYEIYKNELKDVEPILFQQENEGAANVPWLVCVTIDKELDLPNFQEKLKEKGISTRRVFTPIIEFPPYHMYKNGTYSNAYNINEKGLCLPSSTMNSAIDIVYACQKIREVL